jgi:hypothetical protein
MADQGALMNWLTPVLKDANKQSKGALLGAIKTGNVLGDTLTFGFSPQIRGAAAALTGGDYAATRDAQVARLAEARQDDGALGAASAAADAIGMFAPGTLALKGAGVVGRTVANVASRIPGATLAKAATGAVKTAAAKLPGAEMVKKVADNPYTKDLVKLVGAYTAGNAATSGALHDSVADFIPSIVDQAGKNGLPGALGAAVGGGASIAKNTLLAPVPSLDVIGQFIDGMTGTDPVAAQAAAQQAAAPAADPAATAAAAAQTAAKRKALVDAIQTTSVGKLQAAFGQAGGSGQKAMTPKEQATARLNALIEGQLSAAQAQYQKDQDADAWAQAVARYQQQLTGIVSPSAAFLPTE